MNKSMILTDSIYQEASDAPPALLFEMIRSFVALANTLNLSHAVKELGSTRQTVRRHISMLETAMGAELFCVKDRRYQLTAAGERALPDAKDILARGTTWLRGQVQSVGTLQSLKAVVGGWSFYQQQQPIGQIWKDPSILLRETFRAWAMSSGEIESPSFAHVRPHLMVYRESEAGWICVEFGEKSAYVEWFGLDYARSSIGRPIKQLPAGQAFGHLLDQAFFDIQATQLARLDHVFTRMPNTEGDNWSPMTYQRLMMAGFFPDRSPSVMTLVVPTADVNIRDLAPEHLNSLAKVGGLGFDPSDAIFEPACSKEIPK